jgi:hypothetical protein
MKVELKTVCSFAPVMRSAMLSLLLIIMLGGKLQADDIYWDGTSDSWNTSAGWSTSPSSTKPDPANPPGSSDIAIFNISTVTDTQSLSLDANQAVSGLKVLESATGGTTFLGGDTDRSLSIGTGGIEIF